MKQKIVIIGDSHARNSLRSMFSVSSFVKPGAEMKVIVDTVKEETEKLTSEDVIIIWGGSNDIGKITLKRL